MIAHQTTSNLVRKQGKRRGATAMEYGLLAALVSIVAAIAISSTGIHLSGIFGSVGTSLQSASSGSGGPSTQSGSSGSSTTSFSPFNMPESVSNAQLIAAGECPFMGNVEVLASTDGTDIVPGAECNDLLDTQSDLDEDLTVVDGDGLFFNPSGGTVTVPNFDGPGTGFSVPAPAVVDLNPSNGSFDIMPKPTSPAVISTVTAACNAMGGSFSGFRCSGGTPSTTVSSFGSMLLNGGT